MQNYYIKKRYWKWSALGLVLGLGLRLALPQTTVWPIVTFPGLPWITSVCYCEHKPESNKWGRPGDEAKLPTEAIRFPMLSGSLSLSMLVFCLPGSHLVCITFMAYCACVLASFPGLLCLPWNEAVFMLCLARTHLVISCDKEKSATDCFHMPVWCVFTHTTNSFMSSSPW